MAIHKFLKKVKFDKGLRLFEGIFVHSYEELLNALKLLEDDEFDSYIDKKEIIEWILDNYEDKTLITNLKNAKTKQKFIEEIEQRLNKLKKESKELIQYIDKKYVLQKRKEHLKYLWLLIHIILITTILIQHQYYSKNTDILEEIINEKQRQEETMEEENKKIIIEKNILQNEKQKQQETINQLTKENEELEKIKEEINLQITTGPNERITEKDLSLTKEGVLIKIKNPLFAKFAETGSMLPTLNHETKAIQIIPENETEIKIGDIISFETTTNKRIIHRVIEINSDENGWYAVTKGDNVLDCDKEKIRFEQIKRILVALIY